MTREVLKRFWLKIFLQQMNPTPQRKQPSGLSASEGSRSKIRMKRSRLLLAKDEADSSLPAFSHTFPGEVYIQLIFLSVFTEGMRRHIPSALCIYCVFLYCWSLMQRKNFKLLTLNLNSLLASSEELKLLSDS